MLAHHSFSPHVVLACDVHACDDTFTSGETLLCCSILPSKQSQNSRLQNSSCVTACDATLSSDPIIILAVAAVYTQSHSDKQLVVRGTVSRLSNSAKSWIRTMSKARPDKRDQRANQPMVSAIFWRLLAHVSGLYTFQAGMQASCLSHCRTAL